jgi:hypothetical protein
MSSRKDAGEPLEAFHAREIAPRLAGLERHRRQRMALVLGLLAVAGAALVGLLASDMLAPSQAVSGTLVRLLAFAAMFAALLTAFFSYSGLYDRHKEILTGGACTFLGHDYERRGFDFPVERFEGLLPYHTSHRLEDRVTGRSGGIGFVMCEGRFSRQKSASRALLLELTLPRPFRGETAVIADTGPGGNLIERLRQKGERVALESVRFEERFEVYSTDAQEAASILSPRFMERVEELATVLNSGHGLSMAFTGSAVLLVVRIGAHRQRFEPGHVFRPVDDGTERLRTIAGELALVDRIVEALDLASGGATAEVGDDWPSNVSQAAPEEAVPTRRSAHRETRT